MISPPHAWISRRVLAESECWVAQAWGGEIIGMLVLDGTWIEQLYVSPDCQRSGVGGALLNLAKRRAPGRVQLWTFQTNTPAQRFYEHHGFIGAEQTDGSGNEEHAPDIRYVFDPTAARASLPLRRRLSSVAPAPALVVGLFEAEAGGLAAAAMGASKRVILDPLRGPD